jgi:opacity protein-like surface antigen
MKAGLPWIIMWLTIAAAIAQGQRFEVTASVGGQINGGLDLSTATFPSIDVRDGLSRGVGISYQPGARSAVEFMWTYNAADTVAQLTGGGPSTKVFTLDTNQYFGNLLFHFVNHEKRLRPFVLGGLGGTSLSPARSGVKGVTRLAFAVGGGVKYEFSRRFGLRLQAKWSPTYLGTNAGYWCDPVWGGCWTVGKNHYLNELDGTAGITFRF